MIRHLFTVLLVMLPLRAHAVWGTPDVVPAATLLVPYFEVDATTRNTRLTFVSVAPQAQLVSVTLWTDLGIPTLSFWVYLTGRDAETIDLRQLFYQGLLPLTADAFADPGEQEVQISPKGTSSQDIHFGFCDLGKTAPGPLDPDTLVALRNAHSGLASARFSGMCAGGASPDGSLRGYVTIDNMQGCVDDGADPTGLEFLTTLRHDNHLIGSYDSIDTATNFATSDDMVHIESTPAPLTPGTPTFYGRFVGYLSGDRREAIGGHWRTHWSVGGTSARTTSLVVWHEPAGIVSPFDCASPPAALGLRQILVFDDQERVTSAAVDPSPAPRVTQLVSIGTAGIPIIGSNVFGLLDLDLRAPAGTLVGPALDPTFRNSFVLVLEARQGRYLMSSPAMFVPGVTP